MHRLQVSPCDVRINQMSNEYHGGYQAVRLFHTLIVFRKLIATPNFA